MIIVLKKGGKYLSSTLQYPPFLIWCDPFYYNHGLRQNIKLWITPPPILFRFFLTQYGFVQVCHSASAWIVVFSLYHPFDNSIRLELIARGTK